MIMKTSRSLNLILVLSIFLVQCTQAPYKTAVHSSPSRQVAANEAPKDWLEELPGDGAQFQSLVDAKLDPLIKKRKVRSDAAPTFSKRLAKYMAFLMYNYQTIKPQAAPQDRDDLASKILTRLFTSSTQFIMCPDLADFVCLEKVPPLEPTLPMRVEDPNKKLGEVVSINQSLDEKMEWYFTEQIMIPENQVDLSKTLANVLANKIRTEGQTSIYMALYGIDDIQNSMKPVYDALTEKIQAGVDVKAVFDEKGVDSKSPSPLLFTYVQPTKPEDLKSWILTPLVGDKTNLLFQYNVGTQGLIRALAKDAKTDDDAKGRIEYKNDGIMHNKFFIFRNGSEFSVWTGTANVARTCMGSERNSNMGIFIRNTEVAMSFMDEFKEMYEFQTPNAARKADPKFRGRTSPTFPIGRFHSAKTPNTHRLFHFQKDGSDLKVYFSPTDDGEHRAILPMLLSARPGDVIRISMFGAAGTEYVRALQYAAAKGVKIEVLLDSPTAFGKSSWAGKPDVSESTLLETNPYSADATIALKKNARGDGQVWKQNHQKIGLLLRNVDGTLRPEQLIVGSQNWSSSGNDKNDENLIAFRNETNGLRIGADFDNHFRTFLWSHALDINQKDAVPDSGDDDDDEAN
jgi:phosphatidylserine/phosphatidylglycerophosphate/cardiolipin synthase-like enzyme